MQPEKIKIRIIKKTSGIFFPILIGLISAGLFSATFFAFATPPDSKYTPGETLNPTCAAGSTNCTTTTPLTSITGTGLDGVFSSNGLLKRTGAGTYTIDASTYLTTYTETDPAFVSWYGSGNPLLNSLVISGSIIDTNLGSPATSINTNTRILYDSLGTTPMLDWSIAGTLSAGTNTFFAPTVVGGTSTTADLNLKTTSGVGTTGADMHFLVGNNGGTEAITILNNGSVGIGTASPGYTLDVNGDVNIVTGSHYKINGSNLTYSDVGAQVAGSYLTSLSGALLATGATTGATSSSQKFNTGIGILESTGATYYTYFQGGNQSADITYTLPTAVGGANTYLKDVAGNGTLSWATAGGSSFGTTTQIPYTNAGGTDFSYSSGLTFNGTTLTTPRLTVNGTSDTALNGFLAKGAGGWFSLSGAVGLLVQTSDSSGALFYGISQDQQNWRPLVFGGGPLSGGSSASRFILNDLGIFLDVTGNFSGTRASTSALEVNGDITISGRYATGATNFFGGAGAGTTITTGSNDVFIGKNAGYRQTGNQIFMVDASDSARADIAAEQANSLLYGTFASTAATQTLAVNAETFKLPSLPSGGGAANVYWDSGTGKLYQASSSLRYKTNVEPLVDDFSKILQIQPKTFTYKSTGTDDLGYIAEEFDALGLKSLVNYDKLGRPDSLKYDRITLYLTEVVKQQQIDINLLKLQGGVSGVNTTNSLAVAAEQLLANIGITIQNGVTSIKNLVVDNLTVKTAKVTGGIEMTDKATGEVYCTWVQSGEWQKQKGDCASVFAGLPVLVASANGPETADVPTTQDQITKIAQVVQQTAETTQQIIRQQDQPNADAQRAVNQARQAALQAQQAAEQAEEAVQQVTERAQQPAQEPVPSENPITPVPEIPTPEAQIPEEVAPVPETLAPSPIDGVGELIQSSASSLVGGVMRMFKDLFTVVSGEENIKLFGASILSPFQDGWDFIKSKSK